MLQHLANRTLTRTLDATIEREEMTTGKVVVRYEEPAAPVDPNLPDRTAAVVQELTVGALIHFISSRAVARGYSQFREGDAIVTFDSQMSFEGMTHLSFLLPNGLEYIQASEGGDELQEYFDMFVRGQAISTTLLLRVRKAQ